MFSTGSRPFGRRRAGAEGILGPRTEGGDSRRGRGPAHGGVLADGVQGWGPVEGRRRPAGTDPPAELCATELLARPRGGVRAALPEHADAGEPACGGPVRCPSRARAVVHVVAAARTSPPLSPPAPRPLPASRVVFALPRSFSDASVSI